jgi:hypothetical protein
MNFIPPQLMLVIVCTLILFITLILSVIRDAQAVRAAGKLNRLFIQSGKRQAQRSVSVILHLDKRAESITPLLNQLFGQGYAKLEVIIVIKQTAGKHARTQLNSYKKANRANLRLVTYRAGLSDKDVVSRYATSEFVMRLLPDMTLSKQFFSNISFDYLLTRADGIIPRFYTRLDNTIKKAIASDKRTLTPQSPVDLTVITPGIVYKRRSLLKHPKHPSIVPSQAAFILDSGKTAPKVRPQIKLVWFIIVAIIHIALTAYIVTLDWPEKLLLLAVYFGALAFLYISSLINHKAYSPLEKVSLILLSPIFLVSRVAAYIAALVSPRQKYSK